MARQPRIEYADALYHVMSRGDRQEPIFEDIRDREMFLATLDECCTRGGWKVYAWVLMSNHYHLVIQTPEGNLVDGMKWLQNTYTRRLNTRHKKWGHVFGGRYRAILVEPPSNGNGDYLRTLVDYVHLNPARAGLIRKDRTLLDYPWSSLARGYALEPGKRSNWLAVEEGLDLFGFKDRAAGRRAFVQYLSDRAAEEKKDAGELKELPHETLQSTLHRGWYWGRQEFREKLLGLIKRGTNRNYRGSGLGREREKREAKDWLEKGREHFGVSTSWPDAPRHVRVAVAWALHRRTNQRQAWIAETLGLKSAANVSQQVRRVDKEGLPTPDRAAGKAWQSWRKLVENC